MSHSSRSESAAVTGTHISSSVGTNETTTASHTSVSTDTPGINDAGTKPYRDIASAFPAPTVTVPDYISSADPPAVTEFTIPCEELHATDIPFNSKELYWRSWRSKFSTIAALYILAARHYEETMASRRAIHAVFSPPQDDVRTPEDVTRWRQKATEIAQENGLRGGVAIFHGYRVYSGTVDEFRTHLETTEYNDTATDVLLWEWIRQNNWRDHVQWGPHVHLIGLAHPDEDTIDTYRGAGVFEHLRTFEQYTREKPMETISEHRAVAKDTVDHVTFTRENPSPPFTWFGELEGESWWAAEQLATDATITSLRNLLINGSADPSQH